MAQDTVYFVSDTHLGDGSAADRFRYPQQLHDLLVRIESEPGAQLVLLGDFLELWATNLEAVLVRYAPVIKLIGQIAATRPVTYVVGNHDCLPWYYYLGESIGNLTILERFQHTKGNLIALHGHQYDPTNQVTVADGQVKVPWTEKLVKLIGLAERLGKAPVTRAVDDLGQSVDNITAVVEGILRHQSPGERGYPLAERIYDDAALDLLNGGAQYVLMGHTHHPLTHTYGAKVYVNTGSWVSDQYPPTYGRYQAGKLELLEANTHQPYTPPGP